MFAGVPRPESRCPVGPEGTTQECEGEGESACVCGTCGSMCGSVALRPCMGLFVSVAVRVCMCGIMNHPWPLRLILEVSLYDMVLVMLLHGTRICMLIFNNRSKTHPEEL